MTWKLTILAVVIVVVGLIVGSTSQATEIKPYGTLPIANDIEYETRNSVRYRIRRSAVHSSVAVDTALRIAECESNYNADARNPTSTATGVYQFTIGTWEWIGSPGDRLNAQDNIDAFMIWYKKFPGWWECS